MIEAPISTPPKAYMDIISPLINSARGFLESGEALQAFAFVGSLSRNQVVPVMIQSGADAVKDQSHCFSEDGRGIIMPGRPATCGEVKYPFGRGRTGNQHSRSVGQMPGPGRRAALIINHT